MILVTLDVAGIFADFLISLHICEHRHENVHVWRQLTEGLDILSLLFSCLFMVELICCIYTFGVRYDRVILDSVKSANVYSYFKSKFHCFDATTIIVSFLVDVLTRGPVEEAGSLIIILRLFRVFKIVEESGTVATEEIEGYEENIRRLEEENGDLRQRILTMPHALRSGQRDSS